MRRRRLLTVSVDRRSNALRADLQTLAISISFREYENYNAILHSFAALVDSLPPASLTHLTVLIQWTALGIHDDRDWAPLIAAVKNLHEDASPCTRKRVRVAIVGIKPHTALVPLITHALRPIQPIADVDVLCGTSANFRVTSPVPHFAIVV
jgi:hypothetical protein